MIPQRIQLSGFLSYKDEQDLRFESAPVWLLSGQNGSGKSSIFDAVTYALFGCHRGGSQNAVELINKESQALGVSFDFAIDGKQYRIKRTLRKTARGTGTSQQVFQNRGEAGVENWVAVSDTNKKVDFDKWIHQYIGLSYDTFTSSVLLLQGKSEKLLDSKPTGRFEVLAGIVDLERYQRLHERANAKKLELKGKLETLSAQTQGVPEVSDLDMATAELGIEECETARLQASQQLEQLLELEQQARRWTEADERWRTARQRLAQAETVLKEAVTIERDHQRMMELREVLPVVHSVITVRTQKRESQTRTERYKHERTEATENRQSAETALDQARRQKALQVKQLQEQEQFFGIVGTRLRELAGLLQTVRLMEDEQAKWKRLDDELKTLPRTPEHELERARAREEQLIALERILPILERVQTERHDLGIAERKLAEATVQRDDMIAKGKDAKAKSEQLQKELDAARQTKAAADSAVAVARAAVAQATTALEAFTALDGEKDCRACGQPLTPAHFSEEKASRDKNRKEAEKTLMAAVASSTAATTTEQELAVRSAAATKTIETLRDAYKDADAACKQAKTDEKRLHDSLNLRFAEMPPAYQQKIAPKLPSAWGETTYPERDELTALRREVSLLDAQRRLVRAAEAALRKSDDLRSRMDATTQTLAKLKLQVNEEDLPKLRSEQATLSSQEATLTTTIRGLKQSLEAADREIDRHNRDAHQALTHLTDLVTKLKSEDEKQAIFQDSLERAVKQLPETWRGCIEKAGLLEYSKWESELDALKSQGIDVRFKHLEQARGGLSGLRDDAAKLEAEERAFPELAKQTPERIKPQIERARHDVDARELARREAQKQRDKLESYREQRVKLGEQFISIDGQHNRYKVLAELLGRDRLQRYLVRKAERQIVEYANAMLDRLSSGQLFLKLVAGDDSEMSKALEMECTNRISGGEPINVTFLSGSQRFRVAVSLALAIGQYASRLHRPIESVIIDEGFGCLDRTGRQVMIQELQNLRGHLHCILLVSHQEEFAEAFSDGYRFAIQDGATRVTRYQR